MTLSPTTTSTAQPRQYLVSGNQATPCSSCRGNKARYHAFLPLFSSNPVRRDIRFRLNIWLLASAPLLRRSIFLSWACLFMACWVLLLFRNYLQDFFKCVLSIVEIQNIQTTYKRINTVYCLKYIYIERNMDFFVANGLLSGYINQNKKPLKIQLILQNFYN